MSWRIVIEQTGEVHASGFETKADAQEAAKGLGAVHLAQPMSFAVEREPEPPDPDSFVDPLAEPKKTRKRKG